MFIFRNKNLVKTINFWNLYDKKKQDHVILPKINISNNLPKAAHEI